LTLPIRLPSRAAVACRRNSPGPTSKLARRCSTIEPERPPKRKRGCRQAYELRHKGCDLYVHKQAINTNTSSRKMLFQMLGVFAEFEREIVRERSMAGQQRARAFDRVPVATLSGEPN